MLPQSKWFFIHDRNCNLKMVVLQVVQLRIFTSSRPFYYHVRCEALEWLDKSARLTSPHIFFSMFCFSVNLLNWRVMTSFARLPPYIYHLHLSIWHLQNLSSCTSATIEDQIGGIKRCQSHNKDVCVYRMWPDDDWTVWIDSMFCKYHQSNICLFMCWHQAVYGTDIWYW